tara:strand:- start:265 stop:414 length:150 start_codon:yes stop_codon:yes gene_type:complete
MSNKSIKKSSPVVKAAVTATEVIFRSNRNYGDSTNKNIQIEYDPSKIVS